MTLARVVQVTCKVKSKTTGFWSHITTVTYFVSTNSLVKSETATFYCQFECHRHSVCFNPTSSVTSTTTTSFFFWQLLASNKTFSFEHSCWNIYHVYFSRKSILNRTMDALITSGWSLTLKCRPRMTKDSKSFAIFYSTGVLDTSMSKHVQINLLFSRPSGSGRIQGNFSHRISPLRTAWSTYLGILQ